MNLVKALGLVLAGVLSGCATMPTEVLRPAAGVRVLSFSIENAVRVGSLNGEPEETPGLLSSLRDGFDAPLRLALEKGWAAFPGQAMVVSGIESWQAPGSEADHPAWVAVSSDVVSPNSFDFRRARGYRWPVGFRYVSPEAPLLAVALEYPGELLLTVEYRIFAEDVGERTEFRYPDFRLGIWATFRLYGTDGKLIVQERVIGRSTTTTARIGERYDRGAYPELFLQAQSDVLKEWARKIRFKTGS